MRYRKPFTKSSMNAGCTFEGETIETKIKRVIDNKEPIEQISPIIYTERKAGVQPQYDIRTDRFDIALQAMDKVTATRLAKRMARDGGEVDNNGDFSDQVQGSETPSAETK